MNLSFLPQQRAQDTLVQGACHLSWILRTPAGHLPEAHVSASHWELPVRPLPAIQGHQDLLGDRTKERSVQVLIQVGKVLTAQSTASQLLPVPPVPCPRFLPLSTTGPHSWPPRLSQASGLLLMLGPQMQIHLLSEGGGKRWELGPQVSWLHTQERASVGHPNVGNPVSSLLKLGGGGDSQDRFSESLGITLLLN